MGKKLRVCGVTGGRADWAYLSAPLAALRADVGFEVMLIVTGQHLAAGENSAAAIADDGFSIDARVDIDLSDNTPQGVARSAALAVSGVSATLAKLSPDIILVMGDRYEILASAMAALISRMPVAHIAGGDITEGAMDDAFRHAISKLAQLHFVTNEAARRRLLQLGEEETRVHLVGSPGLDRIRQMPIMPCAAWFQAVGLPQLERTLLVTYHPATLQADSLGECREMLAALDSLGPEIAMLFTGANADPEARAIDDLIDAFVARRRNARAVRTLGPQQYYGALAHCDAMVGNSSSGLYEAPSFELPAVNIGERQKGRLKASSVVDCAGKRAAIRAAIERAFAMNCSGVVNPYGDGHACERILQVFRAIDDPTQLLRKSFVDRMMGNTL